MITGVGRRVSGWATGGGALGQLRRHATDQPRQAPTHGLDASGSRRSQDRNDVLRPVELSGRSDLLPSTDLRQRNDDLRFSPEGTFWGPAGNISLCTSTLFSTLCLLSGRYKTGRKVHIPGRANSLTFCGTRKAWTVKTS
jgi:hypothetical protein